MSDDADVTTTGRGRRHRKVGVTNRLRITKRALTQLAAAWGTERVMLAVHGVDHVVLHSLVASGLATSAGSLYGRDGRPTTLLVMGGNGPHDPNYFGPADPSCADCRAVIGPGGDQ